MSYMSSGRKAKPDYTSSTTTPDSSILRTIHQIDYRLCWSSSENEGRPPISFDNYVCINTLSRGHSSSQHQGIVKSLTKSFTLFGLPKSVQTDQGTNFTSGLFKQVMNQLDIPHVTSSGYHPESQGALERFHQTLKTMIKTYCLFGSWKGLGWRCPYTLVCS